MFPDIALYGTTAPDPVPSSSVKLTDAFEQAFADLLALSQSPTAESSTCAGNDVSVVSVPLAPLNGAAKAVLPMQCATGNGVPAVTAAAPDAQADDAAMPAVTAKEPSVAIRVAVEDPPAADISGAQAVSDEKLEDSAEEPAPCSVAATLPPPLPILDSGDKDSSHIAAPAPAASDADPVNTLVLAPAVEPDVAVLGLPGDVTIERETNGSSHDVELVSTVPAVMAPAPIEPAPAASALAVPASKAPALTAAIPTAPASTEPPSVAQAIAVPVHEAGDIDRTWTTTATLGTSEAPRRPATSDDPGPPSLTPRVTRLEEARGRLAAIAAMLASEVGQPSVSLGQKTPAFHAAIDNASDPLEVVAVKGPSLPLMPSLRGTSTAAITNVASETEPQTVSQSTSAGSGDAGPAPAVLHVPAHKPVIPGMRDAALLLASSASPHVSLPNESATAHSIVQTLRMQATRGGGTAVITLAPKYLGSVTVALRVSDGGVIATLHAESSAVRAWIESNVPLLRDGLAEQGLRLERVVIADTPEPHHQADDRSPRDSEQRPPTPPRRPQRPDARSFDVVV